MWYRIEYVAGAEKFIAQFSHRGSVVHNFFTTDGS